MTYRKRFGLFAVIDSIIIIAAFSASFIIVDVQGILFNNVFWVSASIILISYQMSTIFFRMNRKAWEYASIGELKNIVKTLTAAIVLNGAIQLIIFSYVQYRVLFVTWVLMILGIGGARFYWRFKKDKEFKQIKDKKKTMIVGAGSAGMMLARQLLQNRECDLKPVVFVDDDPHKKGLDILSLPVTGGTSSIPVIARLYNIERIVITIPSLEREKLQQIYMSCLKTNIKTQVLPMIEDLVTGKLSVSQLQDVSPEDLLGREQVKLNDEDIQGGIAGKVILVTGAGGSIGSELCRQIIKYKPATLILVGHGENSIYHISMELHKEKVETELITVIADIQDRDRMHEVVIKHRPNQIYHAAAHKHVPLMEDNPHEAVKNNTLGSLNVAEAADAANVETFVMVSTDKAVNPTSVMGASKRLAEMLIYHMNQRSSTIFTVVRFGNVLGSNGSVIPLFKKQIEEGGPVTVTHPEMIRYFMTIPEASRLVLQAGALARGGETFVLDMGNPVKIVDLAKNLIHLSGYTEDEIPIRFTGMRAGEKLYEELLNSEEVHEEQVFPKIYLGKAIALPLVEIEHLLQQFNNQENNELRDIMLNLTNRKIISNERMPIA
ncbi:polysaccharide biosynthesis protein [Alkalicoccus halolimnae]|uniref:Nucleoside-diphosphate sugar epimerase/dehydratase n=1 Tax=Alkalicoccus halolimnae TaxID=1667239 RepID=A0A5C7FA56_9BACI|nr:nucleoside-diphosphate sugar epimerase/dehydratase [Alkalicoccus halolimnae]TXF87512.1 polysaccharide biosynthesis protein [Alkalicoccus halolimnae]